MGESYTVHGDCTNCCEPEVPPGDPPIGCGSCENVSLYIDTPPVALNSWDVEFNGFVNGSCTDAATLNATTYNLDQYDFCAWNNQDASDTTCGGLPMSLEASVGSDGLGNRVFTVLLYFVCNGFNLDITFKLTEPIVDNNCYALRTLPLYSIVGLDSSCYDATGATCTMLWAAP